MDRTILMLEHDDDDRYITRTVFDENQYAVELKFVSDSREFTSYLQACRSGNAPVPSLILLNYHAFPANALGLLRELKSDPKFQHIPVVILSGSVNADIVKQCYHEGASSFIRKPSQNQETAEKIDNFMRYWFRTVELP